MAENPTIIALAVGAVFAAAGYLSRLAVDKYASHRSSITLDLWRAKTEELERRLSEFYWPIYIRLQRDNTIWQKVLFKHKEHNPDDEELRNIAIQIEREIIIPNHLEIVEIIESNVHLSNMDAELENLILKYLRHVDVYSSTRACGILDKDPIAYGEPWPEGFFEAIEQRLRVCQGEYDEHMQQKGILDPKSAAEYTFGSTHTAILDALKFYRGGSAKPDTGSPPTKPR